MPTIRVELPAHLRTLARIPTHEVTLEVPAQPTIRTALDSLEAQYPMLRGTIRDHTTLERRAFLRFFACQRDISHDPPDTPLPTPIANATEPLIILGAVAGGSAPQIRVAHPFSFIERTAYRAKPDRTPLPSLLAYWERNNPEGATPMLTRRRFAQLGAMTSASLALGQPQAQTTPDITLTIAPYLLEASPKHRIQTIAYNNQVPGPLLRMKQGREITVEVHNQTSDPEVVHWHGLFLPPEIDGAMEEGTPMIPPGASTRLTFTPDPAGFRWFHTHTFAGKDLRKGQYTGQHGFLMIEPESDPAQSTQPEYDRELFLALHDWNGRDMASDDGSMSAVYEVSTINGKMLGAADPLRVKPAERILFHILNSSPTEVHWIALDGHTFQVIALDGNPVPNPRSVPMLRLAPAERVSAIVQMSSPGVWILGEVRKHIQAAGMGIVVEYANATGKPQWQQPESLLWNYLDFSSPAPPPQHDENVIPIPLVFASKFRGHGNMEQWMINGKSYPENGPVPLRRGQQYRLELTNRSADDHPTHLHRHTFQLRRFAGAPTSGLFKDVVLVPANQEVHIDFTANNPGDTLFHCHQQDHMDNGFMLLFRYV